MRNFFLSFLSIFVLSPVFFSCEDTDDDKEKPRILEITIPSDTMYIDSTGIKDLTVVNVYRLSFSDNKALSSYKVQLMPGSGFSNPEEVVSGARDSMALQRFVPTQNIDIFGLENVTVEYTLAIPGTFSIYDKEQLKNITYAVRTGKYRMMVAVLDKAGNGDSIFYENEITLLYPASRYPSGNSGGEDDEEDEEEEPEE